VGQTYNGEAIRNFYNNYGEKEWVRLDLTPYDRINFHLHMKLLQEHIGEGKKVLDAGCGAGRFSIEIARAGSEVTLFDISDEQLRIAEEKIKESGLTSKIDKIVRGDLRELSSFEDNTFDTVVCYGAPLNYLLENRQKAVDELTRVTKKGGTILLSVNSKWGVIRNQLGKADFDYVSFFGQPDYWFINEVAETGDLPVHEMVNHPSRHFFEAEELEEVMKKAGIENIQIGGSPCLTSAFRDPAEKLAVDSTAWETIIKLEEQAFMKRTMADNGEFIIAKGIKL